VPYKAIISVAKAYIHPIIAPIIPHPLFFKSEDSD